MTARRLREARHGETVLVAGAKAATQTPPIRSGKRVIFTTLDDGTGLVDLAFFDDLHDACAHTVFHSWLLLVRGVVQRRGPRSLSVAGAAAWNLAELVELRADGGLDVVAARLAEPVPEPLPEGGHEGEPEDPDAHWVRTWLIVPAAKGPREERSCGTRVRGVRDGHPFCVRFQLPPMYEAALLGSSDCWSSPPSSRCCRRSARWSICGAPTVLRGRTAVEFASRSRVRALARYGIDCAIGAGPGPMLARMALRRPCPE